MQGYLLTTSKSLKDILETFSSANNSLEPEMLIVTLLLAVLAIVMYQYRHIFSFIRYRRVLKSLKKKEEKPSKPTIEKVCPRCGEVMEEGFLVGPSGIYWSKNAPLFGLGLHYRGAGLMNEPLAANILLSDRKPVLSSSRCRRCKIIQVDMRGDSKIYGL